MLVTAIFLFAQSSLQTAATQAGRLFMTGQAQNRFAKLTFKTQICQNYLPAGVQLQFLDRRRTKLHSLLPAPTRVGTGACTMPKVNAVNTWAYSSRLPRSDHGCPIGLPLVSGQEGLWDLSLGRSAKRCGRDDGRQLLFGWSPTDVVAPMDAMPGCAFASRFIASTRAVLLRSNSRSSCRCCCLTLLATFDAGPRDHDLHEGAGGDLHAGGGHQSILDEQRLSNPTDMQAITGATAAVLSPFPSAPATVIITQIKQTSRQRQAVVSWSYCG